MGRCSIALLSLLASSCCIPGSGSGSREPTERRELWRGTVAGYEVVIGAELRARRAGGVSLRESVEAMNGRLPVPRYDLDASSELGPSPPDLATGRAQLAALAFEACPIESGLAYAISGRWRVLWVVGGRLFRTAPELTGSSCTDLVVPDAHLWLAAHATGATTCLALDEAGDRDAALDCMARGIDRDDLLFVPPPADGPIERPAIPISTADRDALAARIAESCADPTARCTPSMRALADVALRWHGE